MRVGMMVEKTPPYKRVRKKWDINPKTRVKESKKVYARSKGKKILHEEGEGL